MRATRPEEAAASEETGAVKTSVAQKGPGAFQCRGSDLPCWLPCSGSTIVLRITTECDFYHKLQPQRETIAALRRALQAAHVATGKKA